MHLGTLFNTWLHGDLVGSDEFGNRYYRSKTKKARGREQRWILYRGKVEASRIPPEWHAWLHHTSAEPLTEQSTRQRDWQLEHSPNMTGTAAAYRPKGHAYQGGDRAAATGDYEAWSPN